MVSKYNFSVETNTEKAMRKCRNCLKEISETKLTSELENIINEKYGLKALKIIDDNNLFRSMPKYAYWISLIIKYYKKLSFIEKYTLLYLITGELPKISRQIEPMLKKSENCTMLLKIYSSTKLIQ